MSKRIKQHFFYFLKNILIPCEGNMMKKRILDILLTGLIVAMLSGLLFSTSNLEANENNNLSSQISDFEDQISNSEVITDGNIDSEITIDYSGNKFSKLSAKISVGISDVIKSTVRFVHKMLKKLLS